MLPRSTSCSVARRSALSDPLRTRTWAFRDARVPAAEPLAFGWHLQADEAGEVDAREGHDIGHAEAWTRDEVVGRELAVEPVHRLGGHFAPRVAEVFELRA